ncbi:hypothetical protein [Empedobacter brevis]|uniref:hypothetical protein n=1 Tax=Empedobacter brevis TaxID=247 RepID=UPI0028976CF7|nr:hypothetical protein [Empedobacter brevis]
MNDYEAIMPLPFVKKIGIKFITQPIYCQQLGVFHQKNLSKETFKKFEKKLHRNLVRVYSFNEENTEMFEPKGNQKINYILDLNQSYEKIFNNYSSNRRKELRRAHRLGISINHLNYIDDFIYLKKEYFQNDFEKIYGNKLNKLNKKQCLNIIRLEDSHNNLLGVQIFLNSKNRIICLSFVRNESIEKHNTSAYILDYMIKNNISKPLFFDFEGSMVPQIAKFMTAFGPITKIYTSYSNLKF